MDNRGPRLAYLVSQYPTLSMIFVIREVVELRRLGFDIAVASINDPDRSHAALSSVEQREREKTHYIKSQGLSGAFAALLGCLLRYPAGFLRGLACVFRWGGLDLKRLFMQLMYFTEGLMVGRWLQASGHGHLHVHLGNEAATVGMYVKRVFGTGLSMTIHGPDEFYDSRAQLVREKVEAADFICCISHFARSQLMKASDPVHWHKLVVCRLGVDMDEFPLTRRAEQREGPLRVLCVGRLTPAKGQHILLSAIQELHQRGRPVELRVVGGGVDADSLQRQSAQLQLGDIVHFEGPVNPDRVRSFYERADVFVLPSFAEGIPVVLMEAMAMGVPVISTTVAGIPELIRHAQDGLLVAPSDSTGLADAIESLLLDPDLRDRFAASARARVESLYNLRANVAHLGDVFRERV